MRFVLAAVLIGTGATMMMDIWAVLRRRLFGSPSLDYGLVGRWLAYLMRGRFRHDPIAASPPVRGERVVGWVVHYLTGIAFAALVLAIWGIEWVCDPTINAALIVGIGTVAAPFFLLQPGMGAGVAASRTPRPGAARLQTFITHAIFGLGLYVAGGAVSALGTFDCAASSMTSSIQESGSPRARLEMDAADASDIISIAALASPLRSRPPDASRFR
jgi:hypothetical protein